MTIRPILKDDIPALQKVLDDTGLFSSDLLPEMLLDEGAVWRTILDGNAPIGLCFAEPESLTDGTWNMRAIAIAPTLQGHGFGAKLVVHLEDLLRSKGARVLIVDTSSTDDFATARAFYASNGYIEAARIPDFWAAGDDKIIFWKALS